MCDMLLLRGAVSIAKNTETDAIKTPLRNGYALFHGHGSAYEETGGEEAVVREKQITKSQ